MDEQIINELAGKLNDFLSEQLPDLNMCYSGCKYNYPGIQQTESNRLGELPAFKRQLELKRLVGDLLNGDYTNQVLNSWIVKRWGGISRFNVSDQDRIDNFASHLNEREIEPREFARISSLSKIASFACPKKLFIFDSRVAFSLDGLLLEIMRERPELQVSFFPLPSARGNRSVEMRNRIQRIYPGADFFPYSRAYMEYNDLLPRLRKGVNWEQDVPAFGVEMLLFALGRKNGEIEDRMRAFDIV